MLPLVRPPCPPITPLLNVGAFMNGDTRERVCLVFISGLLGREAIEATIEGLLRSCGYQAPGRKGGNQKGSEGSPHAHSRQTNGAQSPS